MKWMMGLLLSSWVLIGFCSTDYRMFISFSMPKQLLAETVEDATRYQIPVILNGLYQDSMRDTMSKIFELSKNNPNLIVQIDPLAFERYHINQVPALVADNKTDFDVIFGNIPIARAMDEIKRFGQKSAVTA